MLSPMVSSQTVSVPPLVHEMVALYGVMLSTVTAVGGGQGLFCAFNTPDNRHPKDIKQNSNTLFIIKQIDNQYITPPIHLSRYYFKCKNTKKN